MPKRAAGEEGFFPDEVNMRIAAVGLKPQNVLDFEKVQAIRRRNRYLEGLYLGLTDILNKIIE
jgi:hypothetical protein